MPPRGASRTRASCGPTRGFRSWRCPTRIDALLQLAAAPRETLSRTAYNVTAFNPTAKEICDVVVAGLSGRADHVAGRQQTAGDRRLVARGRGRRRGAARLGLRAAVRLPPARSTSI